MDEKTLIETKLQNVEARIAKRFESEQSKPPTDQEKAKFIREFRNFTIEKAFISLNRMHSRAYSKAIDEVYQAMKLTPKLYTPLIVEVFKQLNKVREDWDGMTEILVEETIPFQYRSTDDIINGVNGTEAMILEITEEQEITIKGKRYLIKPLK